jgi:hypothetical protein
MKLRLAAMHLGIGPEPNSFDVRYLVDMRRKAEVTWTSFKDRL